MEIVLVIIMLLVGLSFMLKLTCQPPAGRMVVCLAMALFVGLIWESAAGQSKARISDWLQNPDFMLDMAVLLTVDVFMQISFCIIEARKMSGGSISVTERCTLMLVKWLPGLLMFPTLVALLVEVIFSFPGVDFSLLAWSTAAGVMAIGITFPLLLKYLVPELDLRLELVFMINILIAILGVVATVNGRTAVKGTDSVDWNALAGIVAILAAGSLAGLLIFKRKTSKHIK